MHGRIEKFLSIDSNKAANDYMKRFKKWKKKSKKGGLK